MNAGGFSTENANNMEKDIIGFNHHVMEKSACELWGASQTATSSAQTTRHAAKPHMGCNPEAIETWGTFYLWLLLKFKILMWIAFCSHPIFDQVIATNFCTCHDSYAVMSCANICSNLIITSKRISIKFKFCIKNHECHGFPAWGLT